MTVLRFVPLALCVYVIIVVLIHVGEIGWSDPDWRFILVTGPAVVLLWLLFMMVVCSVVLWAALFAIGA